MEEKNIIKCPFCGTEYLPGEIYLPKYFLGQPKFVERDETGKITVASGNWDDNAEMDLDERFICSQCLTPFSVHANVTFSTKIDNASNPNYIYSTSTKTNIFKLPED